MSPEWKKNNNNLISIKFRCYGILSALVAFENLLTYFSGKNKQKKMVLFYLDGIYSQD